MPSFQYIALQTNGKKIKGTIDSFDQRQAYQSLVEKGWRVIQLKPMQQSILTKDIEILSPKVKSEHLVAFFRQFTTLVRAGIGISDALHILNQQTEEKTLKKAVQQIYTDVRSGSSLSMSLQKFPKIFSPLVVNMVRAGEASGNLDEVLDRLSQFIEKEHITKGKIKSALTYPITVIVIAFVAVAILMWKVVPQFVSTFESLGIELPLITRIVIGLSDVVAQYWYIVFAMPFILIIAVNLWGKTEKGRYILDYIKLKIPVFGKLTQKSMMARFSRTFGSLYAAGVPLIQTLDIVAKVVENAVITKAIYQTRDVVQRGQSLASLLKQSWAFPPLVTHMIAIGEQTGSLDTVLNKVADFYESDVDQMSDRLKSLLEPFMILILTVIVGVIVLAILMPSFAIYNNLN